MVPKCRRLGASNSCLTARQPSSTPTSRSELTPRTNTPSTSRWPLAGPSALRLGIADRRTATSPANRSGFAPAPTAGTRNRLKEQMAAPAGVFLDQIEAVCPGLASNCFIGNLPQPSSPVKPRPSQTGCIQARSAPPNIQPTLLPFLGSGAAEMITMSMIGKVRRMNFHENKAMRRTPTTFSLIQLRYPGIPLTMASMHRL